MSNRIIRLNKSIHLSVGSKICCLKWLLNTINVSGLRLTFPYVFPVDGVLPAAVVSRLYNNSPSRCVYCRLCCLFVFKLSSRTTRLHWGLFTLYNYGQRRQRPERRRQCQVYSVFIRGSSSPSPPHITSTIIFSYTHLFHQYLQYTLNNAAWSQFLIFLHRCLMLCSQIIHVCVYSYSQTTSAASFDMYDILLHYYIGFSNMY